MKSRNIALCIIFTLITCGIYGLYWMIKINDETLSVLDEEGTSGGMVLLLTLVTCGIYGWFWIYKMGQRTDAMQEMQGKPVGSHAILFLVLQVFGLGIVNYAIIQSELNNFAGEV